MKLIILFGLLQVTWALPLWFMDGWMDPYYNYYDPYWPYMEDQFSESVSDAEGRVNNRRPDQEVGAIAWNKASPEDRDLATKLNNLAQFKFFVQNWPSIMRQAMVQLAPVRFVPASTLNQPDKIIVPVPFQLFRPVGVGSSNVQVNLPLNK